MFLLQAPGEVLRTALARSLPSTHRPVGGSHLALTRGAGNRVQSSIGHLGV